MWIYRVWHIQICLKTPLTNNGLQLILSSFLFDWSCVVTLALETDHLRLKWFIFSAQANLSVWKTLDHPLDFLSLNLIYANNENYHFAKIGRKTVNHQAAAFWKNFPIRKANEIVIWSCVGSKSILLVKTQNVLLSPTNGHFGFTKNKRKSLETTSDLQIRQIAYDWK